MMISIVTLLSFTLASWTVEGYHLPNISTAQKLQLVQPIMDDATACLERAVAPKMSEQEKLGELIVEAMPSCVTPIRAMMDAYDRYFGKGTGEAFFMGPYLDALPKAIQDNREDATGPPP